MRLAWRAPVAPAPSGSAAAVTPGAEPPWHRGRDLSEFLQPHRGGLSREAVAMRPEEDQMPDELDAMKASPDVGTEDRLIDVERLDVYRAALEFHAFANG